MILVLLISVSAVVFLACAAVAPTAHFAWVEEGKHEYRKARNVALVLAVPAAICLGVSLDFTVRVEPSDLNDRRLEFPDFSACCPCGATTREDGGTR